MIGTQIGASRQGRALSGRWRNQFGSQLTLEGDDEGGLYGEYRNRVGVAHGPCL